MLLFRYEPLGVSTSSSFQNPPETLGSHPHKFSQKVAKKAVKYVISQLFVVEQGCSRMNTPPKLRFRLQMPFLYTDFTFYGSSYFGDTLTEETAPKWLERASDELDAITFGRLTFAFPTMEAHAAKVKKAVCAIAEALYWIDVQRRASSAQKAEDGSDHGAVASISSGRESISYSTSGANSSVYAAAATSAEAQTNLIGSIAAQYLANIPYANGVNLLYAGGVGRVPRHTNGL